jgi:hypothetical protein
LLEYIRFETGDENGKRGLTLLTTTELLDFLLLVQRLGVERHTNSDTGVVLHTSARLVVRVLRVLAPVGPSLDNQAAVSGRHKALEDVGELLGHLLEGALDLLVLDLVQMGYELFDRLLRRV